MKMHEILNERQPQAEPRRPSQPDSLQTVEVYDNGGITPDRYTVYFPSADYHLVMSDFPNTPRGIMDKRGGQPQQNEKLGKQIHVNQMARGARERLEKELKGHEMSGLM